VETEIAFPGQEEKMAGAMIIEGAWSVERVDGTLAFYRDWEWISLVDRIDALSCLVWWRACLRCGDTKGAEDSRIRFERFLARDLALKQQARNAFALFDDPCKISFNRRRGERRR
jgi:hypothetical protein